MTKLCVTKLCVKDGVCERWWLTMLCESCVLKMGCDKVVCEKDGGGQRCV